MLVDFVIAGAGFGGLVSARILADAGYRVLVVETSKHIGGTAYDEHNEHGVLVQRYGAHVFHTNAPGVVRFLGRFTEWRPYQHRVLAHVCGQLLPIPINLDTVNSLYGLSLTSDQLAEWYAARADAVPSPSNAEEAVRAKVGSDLYQLFYRGYSEKQWGRPMSELSPALAGRVPVRTNRDDRYFTDRFQMMPRHGFTKMFQRMVDHQNIAVMLGNDAREVLEVVRPKRGTVWTGPLDAYFDHAAGRLSYRSMRFTFEDVLTPGGSLVQPVGTINYPNEYDYVRTTEVRHLTGQLAEWTSIMYEMPTDEGPPYYPVPSAESDELRRQYLHLAEAERDVVFIGRLGSYRYMNMDQVTAQAMKTASAIAQAGSVRGARQAHAGKGIDD